MTAELPVLGIIGGSGFDRFPEIEILETTSLVTKYGVPSAPMTIGRLNGRAVAYLPRHGEGHVLPPHRVPYKANLAALKETGARYVIGTCIAGSLKRRIRPGSFVIPDQFVNLTWGRDDYFDPDQSFLHLAMANPYCQAVRRLLIGASRREKFGFHAHGTVVVIQGPRFSTRAESRWFMKNGWDLVNMTQYPEGALAKELGLCYAAIAAVTDYDVGIPKAEFNMDASSRPEILRIFRDNIARTKTLLARAATQAESLDCACAEQSCRTYYEEP